MATVPLDQKFHTIAANVVTKERGSALVNSQKEIFTMEDITSTVRPYKVFTALLTQSGGSNPSNLNSGTLTIGVTYLIQLLEGADFSNVGANNIEGEYFIATGTTPNSWGTGGQLEYNSGAPVATVLENTIGNVWFTYNDVGNYSVNSNALFIESKTWMSTVIVLGTGGPASRGAMSFNTQNILTINTESDVDTASNDYLFNTPIEIRVYE